MTKSGGARLVRAGCAGAAVFSFALAASAATTLTLDGGTVAGGVVDQFIDTGPMPAGVLLLDNGSIPNGSGRTVSGINTAGGWTVYQKFNVPAPGWNVTSVGVDGWEVVDPGGVDQTGTICKDNGANTADCSSPYGSASHTLGSDPFSSNWSYGAYNVDLPAGDYWYRSSADDAAYWGAIFLGTSGLGSYSVQTSTGGRFDTGPTALRIEGEILPEPASLGLLALGGLAALRRRR